jgi:2'-5' RNA ligase
MTMDELLRSFVCLPLQHDLQKRIAAWIRELKNTAPSLKWVRPEALHVTLKFLGSLPYPLLCDYCETLRRTLQGEKIPAIALRLENVEMLPHLRDPRVLCLRIGGNVVLLENLQRLVEDVAETKGIPREKRRFFPHLTLARVREPRDCSISLFESLSSNPLHGVEWIGNTLVVMQSDLRPTGPVYTPISEQTLLPSS